MPPPKKAIKENPDDGDEIEMIERDRDEEQNQEQKGLLDDYDKVIEKEDEHTSYYCELHLIGVHKSQLV